MKRPVIRRGALASLLVLSLAFSLTVPASAFFWNRKDENPSVADFSKNGLVGTVISFTQEDFVLKNGDGNGNAASVFTTAAQGKLTYDDLVDFWAKFDPYEMNALLVSGDVMVKLLKLSEFQNPLTGLNFQGTGKLTTPLGANLLRTSVLPAGTAIGLDKRFALEMVQGSDVTVEYDKLIDRQLERAAVTTISGFAKVFKDASRVLEVKK